MAVRKREKADKENLGEVCSEENRWIVMLSIMAK